MNEFHLRAKRVLLEVLLVDVFFLLLGLVWTGVRYYTNGLLLGGLASLYQVFSIAVQSEKIAAFALGRVRRKPAFGMVSRWVAVMLAGLIAAKTPGISIVCTVIGLCVGWLLLLMDAMLFHATDSK
ncbi:ATP synthase subunit I [Fodinisporobacter ferrooxydans]|uniref:ATP synthase subunit I n=1 Tax=Fodinisporobacter ferrooxydans TaxID=2901836 RepID=A0ABY4CM64_9BACL|nr:ATP synthase subunit I [Alicyclobacillaceae bacterium MYW30-H2]